VSLAVSSRRSENWAADGRPQGKAGQRKPGVRPPDRGIPDRLFGELTQRVLFNVAR
jgi:hypothetical protein